MSDEKILIINNNNNRKKIIIKIGERGQKLNDKKCNDENNEFGEVSK